MLHFILGMTEYMCRKDIAVHAVVRGLEIGAVGTAELVASPARRAAAGIKVEVFATHREAVTEGAAHQVALGIQVDPAVDQGGSGSNA
jgi:hypothetical protein